LTGKKENSTKPVIVDSSSFNPRIGIKSRYSTTMKNWRRKSKIEKIYKIEKPTLQ
jgi:hypothetical protein